MCSAAQVLRFRAGRGRGAGANGFRSPEGGVERGGASVCPTPRYGETLESVRRQEIEALSEVPDAQAL